MSINLLQIMASQLSVDGTCEYEVIVTGNIAQTTKYLTC